MSTAAELIGTGLAAFVLGLAVGPVKRRITDALRGVKPPPKR